MKSRTLVRHGKEGAKNLIRNGWMTFASISSVSIMLLIVGLFLLLIINMNHMVQTVEEDVEIRVHIELTANEKQERDLQRLIEQLPNVESVVFVGRDEGLDQFIESMEDMGTAFEGLREENPFNNILVVRAVSPHLTGSVAERIEDLPNVYSINYAQDVVEKLFEATNLVRNVGVFLVGAMMFTAMFLIANTIKLTIVARKREIQIMKLVGATNGFIRWPFFVEGLLFGVVGAAIPIILLALGYSYASDSFNQRYDMFFTLLPLNPVIYQISAVLLLIGAFIGVWGSMMSVRKFLRV
ncbi:permease-like cell division protein FtsX [Bacillus alkalicellulosilyticus]|uniref:permease-like cell division protein FtsX n=1 Tax=Alkalihalobacterium alkalicellulosilyticum TaxID=1912214 RepID=UPI000998A7AD|nr:permease-like cell division protein FtsX [Bacillus alkalicellulosilyticus]